MSSIILVGVLFFRAEIYFAKPKLTDTCSETHEPISGNVIVQRFARALQFKTITSGLHNYDTEELQRFHHFLKHSKTEHFLEL